MSKPDSGKAFREVPCPQAAFSAKPGSGRSPAGKNAVGLPVHISVCVCTFKRPALLAELLGALENQTTEGQFSYSIVIVDNDHRGSARETVETLQRQQPGLISYFVEPEQSIALARNLTVANARGNWVAFIDDDEVPTADWLLKMYSAALRYNADGVLGPVESRFVVQPPQWLIKAGIFERPNGPGYKTGSILNWTQTGTGNVLVRRQVFDQVDGPFKAEFGSGGEDMDFFRRAMEQGKVFVWCDEAVAYEMVPPERTRVTFQLKRALLRGKVSLSHPAGRGVGVVKSLVAFCAYTFMLPFLLLLGRPVFLKYLIKDFDHIGKLLALCRIHLVRQKYVVK